MLSGLASVIYLILIPYPLTLSQPSTDTLLLGDSEGGHKEHGHWC